MAAAPDPKSIRGTILRWYSRNGRPFPWRGTRDPYRVLVSEIMLQQTQSGRVAERYPVFLDRFPDIRSLARAPRSDVLRAWQGMGYNNRAVRLHTAVREVVASYNGSIPRETEELITLPGIGRYTAHAVACFAHGRRLPVVDVNVRRVLSRIFHPMNTLSGAVAEQDAWELARAVLPANAYDWNQALMDFGSSVCTARSPRCASCPVSGACLSAGRLKNAPGRGAGAGREPSHLGIPRRVWRGKIVELLRARRGPVSAGELILTVRPSGRAPSAAWLDGVLGMLERDGVVSVKRTARRTLVGLAR